MQKSHLIANSIHIRIISLRIKSSVLLTWCLFFFSFFLARLLLCDFTIPIFKTNVVSVCNISLEGGCKGNIF